MKPALFFILLLSGNLAFAKNVALILSGTSKGPQAHDFLRATSAAALCLKDRGFEVTVLAGGPHKNQTNTPEEDLPKYKEDYQFLFGLQDQGVLKRKELNRSTMESTLAETLAGLASGDTLELQVSAHGTIVCATPDPVCAPEIERPSGERPPAHCKMIQLLEGETPSKHPDLKCRHYMGIAGRSVPTEIITNFLQDADRKGVKVNYTMESCFSGFEKPKVTNLQNVCSFYAAGDRNVGLMCTDADSQADIEEAATNTTASLRTRACRGREEVVNNPYFKKSACFQASLQSMRNLPGSTSMESIFLEARQRDRLPSTPVLSCLNHPHFDHEIATSSLILNRRYPQKSDDSICEAVAMENVTSLLGNIVGEIQNQALKAAVKGYENAIKAYNGEVERQRPLIAACIDSLNTQADSSQGPPASKGPNPCSSVREYQAATAQHIEPVINSERELFKQLRIARPDLFAGCGTSACSTQLPE